MPRKRAMRWPVFFTTFAIYALFVGNRVPYSVVKSTLLNTFAPFKTAPSSQGTYLIGWVDTTFLVMYAVGSWCAGPLMQRLTPTRLLLVIEIGVACTGTLNALAYWCDIHSFAWFCTIAGVAGFLQAFAWPICLDQVTQVWYGRTTHFALLLCVWTAHASIGSIVFKVVGAALLRDAHWGWVFAVPALCLFTFALASFVFAHYSNQNTTPSAHSLATIVPMPTIEPVRHSSAPGSTTSMASWLSVQVIGFSLSMLCAKLAVYTLNSWLAQFLVRLQWSDSESNHLSTLFDVGGLVGSIGMGAFVDYRPQYKPWCIGLAFLAVVPVLWSVSAATPSTSYAQLAMCILAIGALLHVPYVLISSVVSADLQVQYPHEKQRGQVLGFINGVGGIGAAMQGYITSWIVSQFGLPSVFYALSVYSAAGASCIAIVGLVTRHQRRAAAIDAA